MDQISPLKRAVELYDNPSRLAAAIGFSQHAVWQAMRRGRVSPRMAVAIERATFGEVRRCDLRPDIFDPVST